MNWLSFPAAVLPAVLGVFFLPAALANAEDLQFPSKTVALQGLYTGDPGSPVTIPAILDLPGGTTGPVPAVIIGHGASGVGPDVAEVVKAARAAGFATLFYDSLASRGLSSTRSGGAREVQINQLADALAAFKLLAADPRIDSRKITYAGLSMGGGVSVMLASKTLQLRELGERRFAAHVAFYPGLHQAPPAGDLSGAPILILYAEKDDYQKPDRIHAYIDHVKKADPVARISSEAIAGALHSFLNPRLPGRRWANDYVNGSLCPILLLDPGRHVMLTLREGETTASDCKPTMGGSQGYSHTAAETALTKAMAFLKVRFSERY